MSSKSMFALPLLLCASLASPLAGAAERDWRGEVLFFGSAQLLQRAERELPSREDELRVDGDVLATVQGPRFRLLAEYLASTAESDLERFQAGFEMGERLTLWVGRFHQPTSAWNHAHHHGLFLQTSITRPAIEQWEDDGGVLPQHVFGLLAETRWDLPGGRGLEVSASAGLPSLVEDGALETFEVLHPDSKPRRRAYHLRVDLLPDAAGEARIGLFAARNDLQAADPVALLGPAAGAGHLDQGVIGALGHWMLDDWHVNAALYHVTTRLPEATGRRVRDRFTSGYLQAERGLGSGFTAYGRVEATSGADGSRYLALFPEFVSERWLAGLRWQYRARQAATLELARAERHGDRYGEARLQWSIALP